MKKILFCIAFFTFSISSIAQDGKFGLSFGYNSLGVDSTIGSVDTSVSFPGLYIGLWGEYRLSEKFSARPEGQMTFKFNNGFNFKEYIALVAFKYDLTDDFNLQLGPQLDYDLATNISGDALGFGVMLGAGYNLNEKMDFSIRYGIPITDRISKGGESKYKIFQIGIGFSVFD